MIMDGLLERYNRGLKEAVMLVAVERERRPFTLSGVFNQNVQASRRQRVADAMAPRARKENKLPKVVVDYDLITTDIIQRGGEDFEKDEIHDFAQGLLRGCSEAVR